MTQKLSQDSFISGATIEIASANMIPGDISFYADGTNLYIKGKNTSGIIFTKALNNIVNRTNIPVASVGLPRTFPKYSRTAPSTGSLYYANQVTAPNFGSNLATFNFNRSELDNNSGFLDLDWTCSSTSGDVTWSCIGLATNQGVTAASISSPTTYGTTVGAVPAVAGDMVRTSIPLDLSSVIPADGIAASLEITGTTVGFGNTLSLFNITYRSEDD